MRDASAPCVPASAAPQPTGSTGLLPLALEFLMRRFFLLLFVLIAAFLACGALAAPAPGAEPTHADAEEHHIPLKPDVLFEVGKLTVTNSMVVTWIVAAGIILCAQLATRKITPVPKGLQNFWEWLVESLYNFLGNLIGRRLVRQTS